MKPALWASLNLRVCPVLVDEVGKKGKLSEARAKGVLSLV